MDPTCKLRCIGKVSSGECSQDQSKILQKANNLEKNKETGKNSSQDQSKVLLRVNRPALSKEAGKKNRPCKEQQSTSEQSSSQQQQQKQQLQESRESITGGQTTPKVTGTMYMSL